MLKKFDYTKIDALSEKAARDYKKLKGAQFVLQKLTKEGVKSISEIIIKSPQEYLTAISILSPQSKATKIEDFLRKTLKLERVPASENRGDAFNPNDKKYIEFKISTTNEDRQINVVQIRPWQKIDQYLIGYIDETNYLDSHFFSLTHEQLLSEIKQMNAGAMHGTKIANQKNENVELALRLPIDSENTHFRRWCEKYSYEDLNDYIKGQNGNS